MNSKVTILRIRWLLPLLVLTALPLPAGYKVRPWAPRELESYPSKLSSEGVTLAAEPLFTDALAAQVFDVNDMVARGIMPLAIIIFNSNDFPVEVEGGTVELQNESDRIRTIDPDQVLVRLYQPTTTKTVRIPSPIPIPNIKILSSHEDARQDLKRKFLGVKRVEPHGKGGGFLYIPVKDPSDLRKYLAGAEVYIPNIYRTDNGSSMMFFEIDLKAAIDAAPKK